MTDRQPTTSPIAATAARELATDAGWLSGEQRARERYQPEAHRQGRALCLSGGGYRATLFHLGALTRLNELGVLGQIDTFCSVSGGSIASALLADRVRAALVEGRIASWPHAGPILDWRAEIADPLRDFTRRNIRTLWVLRLLAPRSWAAGAVAARGLQDAYHRHITELRLDELPERPRFVFCATDMAFGVNWQSERDHVGDYQAGYAQPSPAWPVARAVAASSCFPPAFNPIPVELSPDQLHGGKARLRRDRGALIAGLRLSDGGLYDNLGLEPVWKDHELVLVSDGGATFDVAADHGLLARLGRYMSIVQNQAGALRKRWLISNFLDGELRGAYWGIGSAPSAYDHTAPGYAPEVADDYVSEIRTDLDAFTDAEQSVLENHGYLLADAAIRYHAPELLPADAAAPVAPHPAWMNEGRVRIALRHSDKRRLFGRWRRARLRKALSPEPGSPELAALLERHRPFIQYDSQESYYADAAAELTDLAVPSSGRDPARGNALRRPAGTPIATAAPAPGEAKLSLAFLGEEHYADGQEVQRDDYLDAAGRDYVADARRLHAQPGYAHTIYGHARHDPAGRLWLQYWFFYYYNDKAFLGIGLHEGDWEMIQLRLGRGDQPDHVTYAQHNGAERAAWAMVERQPTDTGPVAVVYSARGSHASYLRAGTYRAPVGHDICDGHGPRIRPAVLAVSDDGPGWVLWPGRWGSTRRGSPVESDSPRGPREHAQWWDPTALDAKARAAAELPPGARAGQQLPTPPTPHITARREGDRTTVHYELPDRAPGQPPATGLVVTVNAIGDGRPPATYRYPVIEHNGVIEHPVAPHLGTYQVLASTVSADGRSSPTVTETVSSQPEGPTTDRSAAPHTP